MNVKYSELVFLGGGGIEKYNIYIYVCLQLFTYHVISNRHI